MATEIQQLGSWMRTRNVLVSTLTALSLELEHTVFSDVPGSDYVRLSRGVDQTLKNIEAHSVYALQIINDEIGASGLIEQLSNAAAKAKREADRIKNATKKVEELTALVDQGTEIVGLFGGLIRL